MAIGIYGIITVIGGLGGSALAKTMAERGAACVGRIPTYAAAGV